MKSSMIFRFPDRFLLDQTVTFVVSKIYLVFRENEQNNYLFLDDNKLESKTS